MRTVIDHYRRDRQTASGTDRHARLVPKQLQSTSKRHDVHIHQVRGGQKFRFSEPLNRQKLQHLTLFPHSLQQQCWIRQNRRKNFRVLQAGQTP